MSSDRPKRNAPVSAASPPNIGVGSESSPTAKRPTSESCSDDTPQQRANSQLYPDEGVSTDVASAAMEGHRVGTGPVTPQLLPRTASREALPRTSAVRPFVSPPAFANGLTDAEIMLRVKAGDEAAFDYLVQKYRRAMVGFMYRMVRNSAAAEDLAQDVFLRVYRSRQSYAADAKFTTWLYRIATNLAVNHARDTRHERAEVRVSLDEPDATTGTLPELTDETPSVEEKILRRERMAAIKSHVQALPERQRVAVVMHKYQGMDYRQIAAVLHLSESATKSLLFRAYETLREKLKEFI